MRANLMLARHTEGGSERARQGGRPVLLAPHSKHVRRLFWVVSLPPPHPSPPTPTTHSHPHNLLPSVPSSCHSLPLSIYNFLLAQTVGVTGGYFLTQGSMSGFNTMCQADSGDASSGAAACRTRRKALSAVVCIDVSQKSVNLSNKQYVCCKGNTS